MPVIQCPINGCDYETTDVEAAVAETLLIIHNNVHTTGLQPITNKQRPPKLDRPKITKGSSEETWNTFQTRCKCSEVAHNSSLKKQYNTYSSAVKIVWVMSSFKAIKMQSQ